MTTGILGLILALGVTVELPDEARVRGSELTLGAIGEVRGDDAAQVARVRAVRLGYAPAPGYSRLLYAGRVLREVAAQAADVQVEFRGASACRVWPQVEVLRGSVLEAAARAELQDRIGVRDARCEILGPLADLEVPAGETPLALRAHVEGGEVGPGQVSVPVQISVDGAVWRSVRTTWRVELWERRPVLAAPQAAGTVLSAEMLTHSNVPVRSATALTEAMLVGSTLTRSKPAGESFEPSDVSRAMLVHVGATLVLEIRRGAVSARVPVSARESGARGDIIGVQRLDNELVLRATVVAPDLVRIDLGQGS